MLDGNATDVNVFAIRLMHWQSRQKIRGLGVVAIALVAVLFVEISVVQFAL